MQRDLYYKNCFQFPISSPQARKDLLVGSLILCTLLIGWIFNLGHRLDVVHRIYHDQPPYYQGFRPFKKTFFRGLQAFFAIVTYLSPAILMGFLSYLLYPNQVTFLLFSLAILLFLLAIFTLPGGMTCNAAFHDISYLYRPDKAFKRSLQAGRLYLKAWLIGLSAIAISFSVIGLYLLLFSWPILWIHWVIFVIFLNLFFIASVWAWNVVGYAFSKALVFRTPDS